jgi:hypothetical protein
MLIPNERLEQIEVSVNDMRATQTITDEGSSESEQSEVAVHAVRCAPRPVVTSATPLANSRIARRKAVPGPLLGAAARVVCGPSDQLST